MDIKKCSKCGEIKPVSEFQRDKSMKDDYRTTCKTCAAYYSMKYYNDNHESILHKRKINAEKTRSTRNEWQREYKKRDPIKWEAYQKQYSVLNRERINARRREYYTKNKLIMNDRLKQYNIKRRITDISFRISGNLRGRVYKAIASQGVIKKRTTAYLVGCSIAYLKIHLEGQFQFGMTWDNYGLHGWHIDHIRPCASFDLTDPEQQKQCFHYTNLQPLWAEDNLKKGAKWNEETISNAV